MFLHRDDRYTGKGFKKLVVLYKEYVNASQMDVAMDLFDFPQEYSQGSKTPNTYEANLRGLFKQFDLAKNPLTKTFQVMFMV